MCNSDRSGGSAPTGASMTAAAQGPGRRVGSFPGRPRQSVPTALAACGLILLAACDKVPLLAPTQSTITLSATSSVLQLNGSTDVTATVIEQAGTAVQNGTTVTFTASLGSVSPVEARTTNGRATVRFTAGSQSGVAEIRAASGGIAVTDPVKITIGAAGASKISLNANPTRVPATGGSSVVTATVIDASGNVLAGVPVTFSTDVGTLSSSMATTSSGGDASVTLTTSRQATVTATAGAATATYTLSVNSLPAMSIATTTTSPLEDLPVVFTLTITSSSASSLFQSVVVNFGDGTSQTLQGQNTTTSVQHTYRSSGAFTVTATGRDAIGDTTTASAIAIVNERPPISVTVSAGSSTATVGTPISFTVSVTPPTNGTVVSSVSLSFGDGTATALGTSGGSAAHAFAAAGTYTVTATATDSLGDTSQGSTQVVITPRVPLSVTVSASPNTAQPGGTIITFTATASPSTNIASYAWDFGNNGTATTTGNVVSWAYLPVVSVTNYTVKVTATAFDGNTGSGQTIVTVKP
jgi:adhesin/invasin